MLHPGFSCYHGVASFVVLLCQSMIILICVSGRASGTEIEAILLSKTAPTLPDMTGAARMAVNNKGDWVSRVSRSNGDVVVRNGVIIVDNNVPKITNNSIYNLSINNHGDAVSTVYREDAKIDDSSGIQVYLNSDVLVTPGQVSKAEALPPGTVYHKPFDAVINDRNEIVVTAVLKESDRSTYQAMTRFTVDADGKVLSEELVHKDGDVVGLGRVANPPRDNWEWEVNNNGSILHYATLSVPGQGSDQTLFRDWEILFREDSESPIPGRIAQFVQGAHLNDSGNWVAHVGFEEGNIRAQMIMRDGEKFLELGDLLPNGGTLRSLIRPIFIDEDRNVYWLGTWITEDASRKTGLFLNDSVLIEDQQTEYQGVPLRLDLGATAGTFSTSDDGRFVIFSAYWNGMAGLFRIDTERTPLSFETRISTTASGLLKISCRPQNTMSRVRLTESHDLLNWAPPEGDDGIWIERPENGWPASGCVWTIEAEISAPFFRVTASASE